jgi:hypothetical protein
LYGGGSVQELVFDIINDEPVVYKLSEGMRREFFFHDLELQLESDYELGLIGKREKNKIKRAINSTWFNCSVEPLFGHKLGSSKEVLSYLRQGLNLG